MMLCSAEDVADWFAAVGVKSRFDDVNAGSAVAITTGEEEMRDRMIAKSSAIIAARLGVRFTTLNFAGSNPPTNTPDLIRYIATVFACRYISSRRNLPINGELVRLYDEAKGYLDALVAGEMVIPGVGESLDFAGFVSNLTVDGSYPNAKIRRVPSISTYGEPNPATRRIQHNEDGPFSRFE